MKNNLIYKIFRFLGSLIIIALIVYVLVYIISCYIYTNKSEKFATVNNYKSSTLIYTSCISNQNWLTSKYNSSYNSTIQYIFESIPDKTVWNNISDIINTNNITSLINTRKTYRSLDGSSLLNPITTIGFIVDSYQKSTIGMTNMNYNTINAQSGYFIAFTTPQKAITMECSLDLGGKTIGYFGFTDEVFIDAVLNGHRIDKNIVEKILISESNISVLNSYIDKIDICITYIIPGSVFHKTLLTQRITFMGFENMDIERVRLFYPGLRMANNIDIRKTFLELAPPTDTTNNVATVTQKENITNLPTMTLQLLLFKSINPIEEFSIKNTQINNKETFITRLNLPNTYLDPTYTCYGDITANIKALCDSPYDIMGKPKTRNTTWDHTCLVDTDCPYFQANKNYKNNRGGCMDSGVCELPIGVRRISFRKYDDKNIFAPYCYGCDAYDTKCCSRQENPDYAFANDTNDRIASSSNLPTSIALYK